MSPRLRHVHAKGTAPRFDFAVRAPGGAAVLRCRPPTGADVCRVWAGLAGPVELAAFAAGLFRPAADVGAWPAEVLPELVGAWWEAAREWLARCEAARRFAAAGGLMVVFYRKEVSG